MESLSLSYSVIIIVQTPGGVPLVRDPHKPKPQFWKFPGGRNQPKETPEQTASRELLEETGIDVRVKKEDLISQEVRVGKHGEHDFFAFKVALDYRPTLLDKGREDEDVQLFSEEDILSIPDLFPPHKFFAEEIFKK